MRQEPTAHLLELLERVATIHLGLYSLEPSIKFTLENGEKSINFLDITISLKPLSSGNQFFPKPLFQFHSQPPHLSPSLPTSDLTPVFSVYRKPSNTGVLITVNRYTLTTKNLQLLTLRFISFFLYPFPLLHFRLNVLLFPI